MTPSFYRDWLVTNTGDCLTKKLLKQIGSSNTMIRLAQDIAPLSVEQLRLIEHQALAKGLPLMQRAGLAAATLVDQQLTRPATIVVLVGPGNNGGDALVAAKALVAKGFEVTAVMPQTINHASQDAREAWVQWLACGGLCQPTLPKEPAQLVIDGLFGIGLTRPLGAPWQGLIDTVNAGPAPILALDVPSGVHADTGQLLGQAIRATWTLSFIAPCLASVMAHTKPFFGQCWVADLQLQAHGSVKPS